MDLPLGLRSPMRPQPEEGVWLEHAVALPLWLRPPMRPQPQEGVCLAWTSSGSSPGAGVAHATSAPGGCLVSMWLVRGLKAGLIRLLRAV